MGLIIEPLVGEILDPGEILWLLAAHPTTYFQFGVTTWGDGSDEYAAWWAQRVAKDPELESDVGVLCAWGYVEGHVSQDFPASEPGWAWNLSHLARDGLGGYVCGHAPCMYLGAGNWGEISNLPYFYHSCT